MISRNPTEYNFNSISKLDNKDLLTLLVVGATTFLSSMALIWLLKYNNATQILPQLQPCVIILTLMTGYFIYKEKVNTKQFYGILLLVAGIFMTNYYKDK